MLRAPPLPSTKVNFGGYSSTALCSKYTRDAPFNGHTECPLTQDWYTLWPPGKEQFGKHTPCSLDEIRVPQRLRGSMMFGARSVSRVTTRIGILQQHANANKTPYPLSGSGSLP